MKKKIKFYLAEAREHTLFQVLEQEGLERGEFIDQAPNGVYIYAYHQPLMLANVVFIRGFREECDHDMVISNEITKAKVLDAFKALAPLKELGNNEYIAEWE